MAPVLLAVICCSGWREDRCLSLPGVHLWVWHQLLAARTASACGGAARLSALLHQLGPLGAHHVRPHGGRGEGGASKWAGVVAYGVCGWAAFALRDGLAPPVGHPRAYRGGRGVSRCSIRKILARGWSAICWPGLTCCHLSALHLPGVDSSPLSFRQRLADEGAESQGQDGDTGAASTSTSATFSSSSSSSFSSRLATSDLTAAYFRRWDDPAAHQPALQVRAGTWGSLGHCLSAQSPLTCIACHPKYAADSPASCTSNKSRTHSSAPGCSGPVADVGLARGASAWLAGGKDGSGRGLWPGAAVAPGGQGAPGPWGPVKKSEAGGEAATGQSKDACLYLMSGG